MFPLPLTSPEAEVADDANHFAEMDALRRREVYAAELMAVSLYEDDPCGATMTAIRDSERYRQLVATLLDAPA